MKKIVILLASVCFAASSAYGNAALVQAVSKVKMPRVKNAKQLKTRAESAVKKAPEGAVGLTTGLESIIGIYGAAAAVADDKLGMTADVNAEKATELLEAVAELSEEAYLGIQSFVQGKMIASLSGASEEKLNEGNLDTGIAFIKEYGQLVARNIEVETARDQAASAKTKASDYAELEKECAEETAKSRR